MPTGNEVEVTFCLTDGTKLTRIENIADITTFLEQHEEYVKIVRCKDCKHYQFADDRAFGMPVKMCEWFGFEDVDDDDFCSRAERRTE